MSGFFLHNFTMAKLATSSIRVKGTWRLLSYLLRIILYTYLVRSVDIRDSGPLILVVLGLLEKHEVL